MSTSSPNEPDPYAFMRKKKPEEPTDSALRGISRKGRDIINLFTYLAITSLFIAVFHTATWALVIGYAPASPLSLLDIASGTVSESIVLCFVFVALTRPANLATRWSLVSWCFAFMVLAMNLMQLFMRDYSKVPMPEAMAVPGFLITWVILSCVTIAIAFVMMIVLQTWAESCSVSELERIKPIVTICSCGRHTPMANDIELTTKDNV